MKTDTERQTVLGLVILACVPVCAVVVAVCQLMNKDYYLKKTSIYIRESLKRQECLVTSRDPVTTAIVGLGHCPTAIGFGGIGGRL